MARRLSPALGRFRQVAKISERLCAFADDVTEIVVTHHPFDVPEGYDERDLEGRAARAMEALACLGRDLPAHARRLGAPLR